MNRPETVTTPELTKSEAFAATFAALAPPPFTSIPDERLHGKQKLTAGFRILAALGMAEGVAGHITLRDPEHTDTFWVNPFGKGFSQICVSDLLRVDEAGRIVEGEGTLNVSAFAIHAEIHRARPDVAAAAHVHSLYGKSWSALGRLLDPISQDACVFFEDHVFHDDTRVLVTSNSEGRELATSLGNAKAAILRNHGLLTVGQTVDEAVWWFIAMERCCQSQFLAESIGQPLLVDPDNARVTRDVSGSHFVGWLHFQTLWNRMVREQPNFLN
jgi:ribulose-5-phosphate 4-epimerase/fuculose-1-phosphate aldolase